MQFVTIGQLGATADRRAVHLSPVAAVQVLDEMRPARLDNQSVLAAHGTVVQHDLTTRVPSQNRAFARQGQYLSGRRSFGDFEKGHGHSFRKGADGRRQGVIGIES